jgi:hypothetical protein
MFRLKQNVLVERGGRWVHVADIPGPEKVAIDGVVFGPEVFQRPPAVLAGWGIKPIVTTPFDQAHYVSQSQTEVETLEEVRVTHAVSPRYEVPTLRAIKIDTANALAQQLGDRLNRFTLAAVDNPAGPIAGRLRRGMQAIRQFLDTVEAEVNAITDYEALVAYDPEAKLPKLEIADDVNLFQEMRRGG